MQEAPKILVIRGGAIGDFILTLPAIGLLREAFPAAHLEILGYKQIISLAEGRYYAQATRSIEYGSLSRFFIPGAELPAEWVAYFASFQQVVSFLYDPDGFFEANVRRAGVKNFLAATSRIDTAPSAPHATRQLAQPLEKLALYLDENPVAAAAKVHLAPADRAFAAEFFTGVSRPIMAIHPGSGGRHKLWPVEYWQRVMSGLYASNEPPEILLVGGEADTAPISLLRAEFPQARTALNLPLPHLAAILNQCQSFAGHDSGISHLAAATGTPCIALFGPTNPAIWAPLGEHVRVLHAPNGMLSALSPESVLAAMESIGQA